MRWNVIRLVALLLLAACGTRGAEGAGTGDRRGVARKDHPQPDLTRPTPATGAPTRGSLALVIVVGTEETPIDERRVAECPKQGCPLGELISLPNVARWCVEEPGAPPSELPLEAMRSLLVVGRKKGGVKLLAPGAMNPLVRSPARIAPCTR